MARSSIHGEGLFASETLPAGKLIGVYDGPQVEEDGMHVLWVENHDGTCAGIQVENEIRFANHSKDPNAGIFNGTELWSMKKIKKGKEILFDYGDDWE